MTTRQLIDITPHPRILQVLGEIEFKPWQCVAELIDNSIDGFLSMAREGTPIDKPTVRVAFGRETIRVIDNGPGMSLEELEMAVKAGWTSQEKFGSLGLYGVGFNIATARIGAIGAVTTIWTTRSGDPSWHGLELDLRRLAKGTTFYLEPKTRTKSDPNASGTDIEVSPLRSDWRDQLNEAGWVRGNITERLARVYGAMLRDEDPQPIKFSLYVNDKKVQAWQHCVWPADWEVYRKGDNYVRPIQEIDETYGIRYLVRSTEQLYDSREEIPDGIPDEDILEVKERVYGWIGIQRYADEKDYGIDILRNGRKIEVGCKDFFIWEGEEGETEIEYPIDELRARRGRIVGEVHLDHGYVHYTKNKFEREHSSWTQLRLAIHYNQPLTNRERKGFEGQNTSKLGLLFRTFRRNSPSSAARQKWADILFIKENDIAKKWAEKYRKGVREYLDDSKWRELLDSYDTPPPAEPSTTPTDTKSASTNGNDTATDPDLDIILGAGAEPTNGRTDGAGGTAEPQTPVPTRTPLPGLSLHITGVGLSGTAYDVEVYAVDPSAGTPMGPAWRTQATARGVYEVEVNAKHPVFNSTTLQVRDAVLADIANIISGEEMAKVGRQDTVTYAAVLSTLRTRYAITDSLDPAQLQRETEDLRSRITNCLGQGLSDLQQRALLENLPQKEKAGVELAQARGTLGAPVVSYLELRHILHLLEQAPALMFEGGCFNRLWTPPTLASNPELLEEYRRQLPRELIPSIAQLVDFIAAGTPASKQSKSYLALVRACVNITRENLADVPINV